MPARCAASAFSFRPADRQHLAGERDLAGHRDVVAHGRPVSSDTSAVAIVMPALGPSFGIAPAGTWTCRSWSANQSSAGRARARAACAAHVGQRRLGGLLHDVAELAGDRQLALARDRRGLDEQHVAADRRPRQARSRRRAGAVRRLASGRKRGRPSSSRTRASPTLVRRTRPFDGPRRPGARPCGTASRSRARGRARPPRACTRAMTVRSAASENEIHDLLAGRCARSGAARGSAWRSGASRPRCSPRAG